MRVLKWIVERVQNKVEAKKTPIGLIPNLKDFEMQGLNIPQEKIEKLFEINPSEWQQEASDIEKYLAQFAPAKPILEIESEEKITGFFFLG